MRNSWFSTSSLFLMNTLFTFWALGFLIRSKTMNCNDVGKCHVSVIMSSPKIGYGYILPWLRLTVASLRIFLSLWFICASSWHRFLPRLSDDGRITGFHSLLRILIFTVGGEPSSVLFTGYSVQSKMNISWFGLWFSLIMLCCFAGSMVFGQLYPDF